MQADSDRDRAALPASSNLVGRLFSKRLLLCVVALAAALVPAAAHAATGLVAGYAFSEGSGTTTADASASGITGTLVNGPVWVGGKNGTGLSFNGSSTYVDLGNPAALGFTGSMTLSAWVFETANVGDDGQIVAKSDGGSGWQLKSTPDTGQRTFGIAISNASGAPIQRYSSTVRALNTWYHVAGVYDATARTLNIYVNGVLSNGVLSGTVPTSQLGSPVAANIGRRTGGFNIQGIVDDVRIYGRALTVAEIQADMATPVAGAAGDTTPPSAPTNLTATAISSSQINLSWTASTDNVAVTGYLVERCQGAGCSSFAQIATPTGTTYNDTGRTANTSYSYRVRAIDTVPNVSGYSNTASAATTAAADTTPPTAPTNLTATAVSSSQINLSWTASTDNVAVTGYLLERCQGAGCSTFAQIATPAGTTYNDTGRTANTSYSYRVRATDAVPNLSAYSNTASATTPAAADTTPPTAPTNLTATAVSSSQINLSWTASTDNVGVTGYLLERCQGAGCSSFAQIATPAGTTYNDTGRTTNTSYSYRVRATDAVPNLSGYSSTASATTLTADTTPPNAPTNLTASAVSSAQINLSWTASTDNVAVTGYLLERCQGAGCTTFAQIATPTGTTYNDTGRTASTSYNYRVRATDAVPNLSGYSNTASATTPAATGMVAGYAFAEGSGTTTADASASGITGTLVGPAWVAGKNGTGLSFNGSSTYVDLSTSAALGFTGSMTLSAWVFETANVGDDGQIVAKSDGGSGWQLKSTPDTGARTFGIAITNSSGGDVQRYSSTVRALNTWYHVAGVYDATARTLNIYVNGVLSNGALSGTVPTSQRASTVAANIGRRTGGFNIQGIVDDVRIYGRALTVAEIQADMATPVAGAAGDTTPPSAPTNLTATAASSTQINLSWTASTDNVAVTGYLVERCQGAGCSSFAQIATPTGTTYNDTGRTAATSYSYRVRATDAVPNLSGYSNTASATTLTADTTPPTAPTNLTATAVSSAQINLSWTASTDNVAVTGYRVERCQGLGCTTFAQIATPSGTTYNDTGRTANTSYSYRVRATDAVPNLSGYSNTASATTFAGADTTPPTAPTNLTATAVSSTQINLSWTASTDNVAVTGYLLERCQGAGCSSFAQIATPSGTTYNDTGRTAATSYSYRVRATDAVPNLSGYSNTASATTTASSGGSFLNEILMSGFNLPTAVKFLPDGSMLVLELGGKIWKVNTTTWQASPTPFLTLTNIGGLNNQQGLLELVLDPSFATNRFYYVFYTLGSPNRDRVSRFTATADLSGTVAGSEFVLYQDPQAANVEHHGGAMNFGNDGKLYITTGEHFDPPEAQSLTSPRGKVLRINKDGTVPTDNPFYDGAGPHYDAIWALGLRNPFRASYDAITGRLYIGDVGGNVYSTAREEVNVGAAGANFGWPNCEGFSCTGNPAYTNPLYDYGHNSPSGLRDAAVTGGFVYRGSQFPAQYYGNYFFADYAQNWIKRLTLDPVDGHVTGVFNFEPPDGSADGPSGDIVQLLEGPDGALYYVDLGYSDTTSEFGVSKIRRIRFVPGGNQPPVVVAAATSPTSGPPPLSVSFSSAGTSDPEGNPLSYSWTFGDGATSTQPNPTHTYVTRGQYTARLTVSDGTNSTPSSPITIRVGNPPVPTITTPADGSLFRAGDTISFSGNATDAEDGVLPASAFTWSIDFLHEGHVHPGVPQTGTKAGSFVVPTTGHDFHGNTRYRVTLTVTDSDGIQSSQVVLIYPQKVNLTLDTVPSGLTLTLDGLPLATPIVYDTLIGFNHQVQAADQTVGTTAYTFISWSDGGARTHTIVVPATNSSLVATYSVSSNPLPSGLVAGYRFNEGSGVTTADLSGNANTGALVNGPTWTTGLYGSALAFSGTNSVSLGNGPSLQLTGSMTLTAWIRISANPFDDGAIVAKLGAAGWQLKTSADTGVRTAAIQISSNGADAIQRYSGTVLAVGTWYHVAGVYDATARTLSIYVNGVVDNGLITDIVPAIQFNAPLAVNIAQRTGDPVTFNFQGTIDEVHIFNRALTAAEIQTDMTVPR